MLCHVFICFKKWAILNLNTDVKIDCIKESRQKGKNWKKNSVTALLTCEHWYLRKKILIIKKRKEKKEVEGRRRLCQIHYLLPYICECAQNFDYLCSTKFQQVIKETLQTKGWIGSFSNEADRDKHGEFCKNEGRKEEYAIPNKNLGIWQSNLDKYKFYCL